MSKQYRAIRSFLPTATAIGKRLARQNSHEAVLAGSIPTHIPDTFVLANSQRLARSSRSVSSAAASAATSASPSAAASARDSPTSLAPSSVHSPPFSHSPIFASSRSLPSAFPSRAADRPFPGHELGALSFRGPSPLSERDSGGKTPRCGPAPGAATPAAVAAANFGVTRANSPVPLLPFAPAEFILQADRSQGNDAPPTTARSQTAGRAQTSDSDWFQQAWSRLGTSAGALRVIDEPSDEERDYSEGRDKEGGCRATDGKREASDVAAATASIADFNFGKGVAGEGGRDGGVCMEKAFDHGSTASNNYRGSLSNQAQHLHQHPHQHQQQHQQQQPTSLCRKPPRSVSITARSESVASEDEDPAYWADIAQTYHSAGWIAASYRGADSSAHGSCISGQQQHETHHNSHTYDTSHRHHGSRNVPNCHHHAEADGWSSDSECDAAELASASRRSLDEGWVDSARSRIRDAALRLVEAQQAAQEHSRVASAMEAAMLERQQRQLSQQSPRRNQMANGRDGRTRRSMFSRQLNSTV